MSDARLRQIFQNHLSAFDWQSVETWSTGRGVPDLNFCYEGVEGWIELKRASGWRINITPEQIGWMERRARHGGRVFVAVRRQSGTAVDTLYLFPGAAGRALSANRVSLVAPLGAWQGGPAAWNWGAVKLALLTQHVEIAEEKRKQK
jgi:hypothetical protein